MDRSSLVKFLGLGLVLFLFIQFGLPKITGGDGPKVQPLGREWFLYSAGGAQTPSQRPSDERCELKEKGYSCVQVPEMAGAKEQMCTLETDQLRAELSSQGATLKHLFLKGAKYTVDGRPGSKPMDLVTTPDHEARRPLYTALRQPGADSQVTYDLFDWKLEKSSPTECLFTYTDSKVVLRKAVRSAGRPFELETELSVQNKGERATHRASIETSAWRYETEIEGGFGRQSPFVTQVECLNNGKLEEATFSDFGPKDFSRPEFKNAWKTSAGAVDFAATANFYFAQALVPLDGPAPASCERLIEERYNTQFSSKKDDRQAGAFYRSRLAWPAKELGTNETATYKTLQFIGPKERDVLAAAAGGSHHMSELIRLGTFAVIAKVLVAFLVKCQGVVGSWGLAIILMTLSVRTALFPLTWKTIKSGAKMRQLKPELDAINKKFEDDAQQKQLATMELWQKHGVNPVAGCLPMLVQMPVWFALYTTLQTAAELYHTPFLWFRDLSAPDTFHFMGHDLPFLLPALLGVTSFIQQKIMPAQMDEAQQKMMTYMMPAIFTAMMLFLPAGLGVYMFTNSLLGILQQLAVERYYASQSGGGSAPGGGIEVREKTETEGGDKSGSGRKNGSADLALGKGNARV
jgi:YidC/Oxa1 family membrane protein insertase